jgi:hypothetical protein
MNERRQSMREFPAPGDSVQMRVNAGDYARPYNSFKNFLSGATDRYDLVRQVTPYGMRVEVRMRYHVPEKDRDLYGGEEYMYSRHLRFYPWTNIVSVEQGETPAWAAIYDDERSADNDGRPDTD